MTFNEIVLDVMNRLNLTSTDAQTRIRIRVNDRYRRVCSSIGLNLTRALVLDMTIDPATSTGLPDLIIDNMEKVLRVCLVTGGKITRVLPKISHDDVTRCAVSSRLPEFWAVKRIGSNSTTITLDSFPDTDTFDLKIDGYDIGETLEDDAEPAFPADFHDILIEGAMSDEQRKMEKPQLAQIAEANYASRLSDLRMFIAKDSYMDVYQGKNKPSNWWRFGFGRISMWN